MRAHARAVVDVGAGDGRFALELARTDPNTLAIALDASTDRLVDGARLARRHGVPNVLFVVSSVERLPDMLGGIADEATIHFPSGALLRGVTRDDEAVLAPLARLLRIGGPPQPLPQGGGRPPGGGRAAPPPLLRRRAGAGPGGP